MPNSLPDPLPGTVGNPATAPPILPLPLPSPADLPPVPTGLPKGWEAWLFQAARVFATALMTLVLAYLAAKLGVPAPAVVVPAAP